MSRRPLAWALLPAALLCAGLTLAKDDDDPVKAFKKALKGRTGPDTAALVEAANAMADQPSPDGVELLIKYGPLVENINVYLACRDALAAATNGKPREELIKGLLSSKRPEQRVICADALGGASDGPAVAALAEALDDKEKSVRMAAVRSLQRIERKECVEPLFKRLAKVGFDSKDAEAEELYGALHTLTGQAFQSLEDWEKYWETVKGDFDPKNRPKDGDEATTMQREGEGQIFDSVIRSQGFVLVFDISSSMRVIDLPPGETWKDPKGKSHKYKDPDPTGRKPPHPESRFQRTKEAVVKFIEGMSQRAQFSMVVFGEKKDVTAWKPALVPANAGNKKEAIEFVQALKWSAATRTDLGLEQAFEIKGDVDSIYLFTDGLPEKLQGGKAVEIPLDEISEKAATLNRTRKLKINCYSMSSVPELNAFLAKLAADNGGEYKDIRVR